ncbi:MAG: site-specific integrase [Candidatus Thiodiazotropha lotti]|nr:site-specific integrase [Candidatus Thiodiazotropha lotti]MCW4221998.1 site-specific integrase [Candidatus Thiodiazotropha lotti]
MSKKNKGIHLHYRKDRDCWEIREFIGGKRKRHATGFSCRKDAEEKLAEILVKNTVIKDCPTVGKVISYYIQEHLPTIKRPDTAIKCLERLIPYWSEIKLEDIRKSTTLKYYEYRKREFKQWQKMYSFKSKRSLSLATVRRELEQLQAAVNYAHKDNIINIRPYIWKPEKSQPRTRWLTVNEAARLVHSARTSDKAKNHLPMFILIALYTGARSEAIFRLRWSHVDLERGYIDFTDPSDSRTKQTSIIPISNKLLGHLRRHNKYGTDVGYVIHINQHRVNSVKTAFRSACKRANLKNVTPHVLRHTAASWRVQRRVPTYEVAKLLGHSSAQMVEKVYGHLSPDHLMDAKER